MRTILMFLSLCILQGYCYFISFLSLTIIIHVIRNNKLEVKLEKLGCISTEDLARMEGQNSESKLTTSGADAKINLSSSRNQRLPMKPLQMFSTDDERTWKGPFSFVHAADCQLGLIEKQILKKSNPRWDVDILHLKCAIDMVNKIRPKPKFMVLGGDMVDTPPYLESMNTHVEQYNDLVDCLDDLDPEIKLVCVCGNHDVGDVPTEITMDVYHNEFGPDYFTYWLGGVKFTVLNSQYFKCPEVLPMATFQHFDFLSAIKNDDGAVHSVVFQHVPLCIEQEDEIDISFLNIDKSVRKDVISEMTNAKVDYIFYGHTHRNGLSSFGSTQQILTGPIGGTFDDTQSGFRIVYVTESEITHEYIPLQLEKMDDTQDQDDLNKNVNQKLKDI